MKRLYRQSLILFMILVWATSLYAGDNRLVLTGSSTVAPLALEIAKRYEIQHPGVRIDVQTGGSSRGINDARIGLADIGMVSRALHDSEQDLTPYLIARDGISMIVHKSNVLTRLSNQQIIDIYTGKVRNWKQVGGHDQIITVVNKAEGRSTLELFLHYFKLKNSQINAQVVVGDNQQGMKTVAGNPGAIGYVSIGAAEYEEKNGAPIKRLPMGNQSATVDNVANGHYPLSRELNLVVEGKPTILAKHFIDFAQSEKVKDLIKEQFFVAP